MYGLDHSDKRRAVRPDTAIDVAGIVDWKLRCREIRWRSRRRQRDVDGRCSDILDETRLVLRLHDVDAAGKAVIGGDYQPHARIAKSELGSIGLAEDGLQGLPQDVLGMLRSKQMAKGRKDPVRKAGVRKNIRAIVHIEVADRPCWKTESQSDRNDAARRCPGDEIEVIDTSPFCLFFEGGQYRRREGPHDAAALEAENSKLARQRRTWLHMFVCHGGPPRCPQAWNNFNHRAVERTQNDGGSTRFRYVSGA